LWKAKQAERKKARNLAKAKHASEKPTEKETNTDDAKELREQGNKPKKKLKKTSHADIFSTSMAVDGPATRPHLQGNAKGKAKEKDVPDPDSDATARARPTKRPKREVHTDTSFQTHVKEAPASPTKAPQNRAERRFQDGKRQVPPKLKRHDTSLYFADDEKLPASPASPAKSSFPRSKKAKNPEGAEEVVTRKTVTFAAGTKRRSGSRHDREPVGAGPPTQGSKRGPRKEKTRGKSQDESDDLRGRPASRGKGKGKGSMTRKGLSAGQRGDILQIFD